MMIKTGLLAISLAVAGTVLFNGCSTETEKQVSFKSDVQPIFAASCNSCHTPPEGTGYTTSGLDMTNYDALMKGTKFGPIIVAGDAESSTLNRLVEGKADPSIRMPHGDSSLPAAQQATLRTWVEQGAANN